MPGHVRNKNIQFDDDDYYDEDDYYEDDYDDDYYDEPVAQPKPTAQPKPAQTSNRKGKPYLLSSSLHRRVPTPSPSDHFEGIVWGHVPPERMSRITEEPRRRHGRLLGGSGKPSKLQALAAQRRKQQEEKRSQGSDQDTTRIEAKDGGQSSLGILDKLNKRSEANKPEGFSQDTVQHSAQDRMSRYKRQKVDQDEPALSSEGHTENEAIAVEEAPSVEQYTLRAPPSMFASALMGRPQAHSDARQRYSLVVANTDPFAGPSPDDVVSKAQSKASQTPKKPPAKQNTNGVTQGVASMKIAEVSLEPSFASFCCL